MDEQNVADVVEGIIIEPDDLNISSEPNYYGKVIQVFQLTTLLIFVILLAIMIVNKIKNKKINKIFKICFIISSIILLHTQAQLL